MLLGFGAAIPLGPINILIMNEALKVYKNGVAIGFGAMCADATYLILILFGLILYINQPDILKYLSLFGGVFLLYLAFLIFKNRNQTVRKLHVHSKLNVLKLYIKGYVLTLLNPYTIFFWLSVTTYSRSGNQNPMYTVLGMMFAILLWITIMPYVVHRTKHLVSNKVTSIISIVSSIILLGFGASMLLKVQF